jgi:hypothetical protein
MLHMTRDPHNEGVTLRGPPRLRLTKKRSPCVGIVFRQSVSWQPLVSTSRAHFTVRKIFELDCCEMVWGNNLPQGEHGHEQQGSEPSNCIGNDESGGYLTHSL